MYSPVTEKNIADGMTLEELRAATTILVLPGRAPVVMAIYTTRNEKGASSRDDIVAAAARIVSGII